MSQPAPRVDTRLPRHLLIWQGMAVLGASALTALAANGDAGLSLLAGGLVTWLANAYFAWQAFRVSGQGKAIMRGFYKGMMGKFALMFTGLGAVFTALHPAVGWAVLAGIAINYIMIAAVPLLERPQGESVSAITQDPDSR